MSDTQDRDWKAEMSAFREHARAMGEAYAERMDAVDTSIRSTEIADNPDWSRAYVITHEMAEKLAETFRNIPPYTFSAWIVQLVETACESHERTRRHP